MKLKATIVCLIAAFDCISGLESKDIYINKIDIYISSQKCEREDNKEDR